VDEWIALKDTAFYRGIVLLPERWEKVVENGGNYNFEVYSSFLQNKLILETKTAGIKFTINILLKSNINLIFFSFYFF